MKHMHSIDYGHVDCEDCLRRAIAEGDERTRVLRGLLAKVEVTW